jgi:hypothetical protein
MILRTRRLSRYTVEVWSVTAPCGQYSNYDSILSVCSGDHDSDVASDVASDVGWATTHSKSGNGKVKGTLNLWKNKEPVKKVLFDGIDCRMQDVPGNSGNDYVANGIEFMCRIYCVQMIGRLKNRLLL